MAGPGEAINRNVTIDPLRDGVVCAAGGSPNCGIRIVYVGASEYQYEQFCFGQPFGAFCQASPTPSAIRFSSAKVKRPGISFVALVEASFREEITFWRQLRDKYRSEVNHTEQQRIQEAVDYSEKKLAQ